jgi:curved DNA-binding protein CbpA
MPTAKIDATQIQKIYRSLAIKWHPDKGGNHAAMAAINEFYELIKQAG